LNRSQIGARFVGGQLPAASHAFVREATNKFDAEISGTTLSGVTTASTTPNFLMCNSFRSSPGCGRRRGIVQMSGDAIGAQKIAQGHQGAGRHKRSRAAQKGELIVGQILENFHCLPRGLDRFANPAIGRQRIGLCFIRMPFVKYFMRERHRGPIDLTCAVDGSHRRVPAERAMERINKSVVEVSADCDGWGQTVVRCERMPESADSDCH
jgi:hypothetical protein